MTASTDDIPAIDPDTPTNVNRDKKPIPLPEGQPGDDGSDPAPENDMESGLLKPLANTPVVRSPNPGPAAGEDAGNPRHVAHPLGNRANTGVTPTPKVPGKTSRERG